MTIHSTITAWKIPWMEELGRLQCMESQRVGHDLMTKHICVCVCVCVCIYASFPDGSVVKNPPTSAGDVGLISESGRSPGGGNGNLLQYSCLGPRQDRGAWQTTVHEVTKSWT